MSNAPTPISEHLDNLREAFEERAAIMEYDGGLSREDAERAAYWIIYEREHDCLAGNTMQVRA